MRGFLIRLPRAASVRAGPRLSGYPAVVRPVDAVRRSVLTGSSRLAPWSTHTATSRTPSSPGACSPVSSGWSRIDGATSLGGAAIHLLALPQTLLVAQAALGLLLLSGDYRAADQLHYVYGAVALGVVLSPWFYAPADPAEAAALVRSLGARRRGARRSWHHDRSVRSFLREPDRSRPRDRRADRARRRRAVARARAGGDRRAAADRVLPRDRLLPLPGLARAPRGPRGVVGSVAARVLRSDRPGRGRRRCRDRALDRWAAMRSRSSRCSRCCVWAVVRTWRAEHTYA